MIVRKNSFEAWRSVLQHVLEHGERFLDTNGRDCQEVLNLAITVKTTEKIDQPIYWLQKEKNWVYPSKDELLGIIFNKKKLPLYSYTYGSRIFDGVDQINDRVVPLLQEHPESRRAAIAILDPRKDHLSGETPGLTSIHFRIKSGKLFVTAVMRSLDCFLGWPANIVQIHALQEHIAEKLTVGLGEITVFSVSAHIYTEWLDRVQSCINF